MRAAVVRPRLHPTNIAYFCISPSGAIFKLFTIILHFPKFPIPLHFQPEGHPSETRASFSPGDRLQKSTPARMAESVDALVSNTSGAIRAGSIPAPGTEAESQYQLRLLFH